MPRSSSTNMKLAALKKQAVFSVRVMVNGKVVKGKACLGKVCDVDPLNWIDIWFRNKWECAVRQPQIGVYGNIGELQVKRLKGT